MQAAETGMSSNERACLPNGRGASMYMDGYLLIHLVELTSPTTLMYLHCNVTIDVQCRPMQDFSCEGTVRSCLLSLMHDRQDTDSQDIMPMLLI